MMKSLSIVACGTRWEQSMGAAPSFATPRGGRKQRAMSLAARRIVGELEEGMGDDKERNSLLAFAEMLENRGSASGRSRGALTAQIFLVAVVAAAVVVSWVVPVLITLRAASRSHPWVCFAVSPAPVQRRRSSTGSSRLSRAHTSTAHPSRTPPVGTLLGPRTPLRSSSNPTKLPCSRLTMS